MELALKNCGKLIDKREVSGNVDIIAINGNLSEEALLQEIEDLKKKIEGSKPNIPQLKEARKFYEDNKIAERFLEKGNKKSLSKTITNHSNSLIYLVPEAGIEPARDLSPTGF
jgi:hypothetical protein